ncbi:MAG TPA: cysteine rich repeat-containing protein [Elusimicrobiales bacterium]|nr:cysteine rich repeat-containing protein [Elusimicrobiales bacterium]
MKNLMIAVLALGAGLGLALNAPAAAEKGAERGAEKGKGPCAEDTVKFCADIKPGEGRIAACLKEHEKDLSQACRDRKAVAGKHGKKGGKAGGACMGAYGKGFSSGFKSGFKMQSKMSEKGAMGSKREMRREGRQRGAKACAADREKFCAGVKPGEGRIKECLRQNLKDLSETCRARQEKAAAKPEANEKKV